MYKSGTVVFCCFLLLSGCHGHRAIAKYTRQWTAEWSLCEWVGMAAGGTIAFVAAPAAATAAVGALGFKAGGIVAGSYAAGIMSSAATTGVGAGWVGLGQSIGAAGIGVAGKAVIGAVGAAMGGTVAFKVCPGISGYNYSGKNCNKY